MLPGLSLHTSRLANHTQQVRFTPLPVKGMLSLSVIARFIDFIKGIAMKFLVLSAGTVENDTQASTKRSHLFHPP